MPDEWLNNSRAATYQSTSNVYALMEQAGYDSMSIEAKLDWLVEQGDRISQIPSEKLEGQARALYRSQLEDIE